MTEEKDQCYEIKNETHNEDEGVHAHREDVACTVVVAGNGGVDRHNALRDRRERRVVRKKSKSS